MKKDAFVVTVDDLFDGEIEVTPDGVPKDEQRCTRNYREVSEYITFLAISDHV